MDGRLDLTEDGDPAHVAPTVRRTLFRVVQESLTNVHKHAPGARVTVDVRYGAESVRASVHNGPSRRPPDAALAAAGGGAGLLGLRHHLRMPDLVGLVRVGNAGHTVLSPEAAQRLVGAQDSRQRARERVGALTERELEVLAFLGAGRSNLQIARRLHLSEATVKGYVSRLLVRLDCDDRTQAGLLAHEAGLGSADA